LLEDFKGFLAGAAKQLADFSNAFLATHPIGLLLGLAWSLHSGAFLGNAGRSIGGSMRRLEGEFLLLAAVFATGLVVGFLFGLLF
jgi:hypothetical protein